MYLLLLFLIRLSTCMKIKTKAQTDFRLFSSTIVTAIFCTVYVDIMLIKWCNKWLRTDCTSVYLYACMNSQKSCSL